MIKIKVCGLIALLFVSINAFSVEPVDPSLIGYYKLDGNAFDSTANEYDGTIYSASASDAGIDNGCYDFNGVNTAIVVADPAAENRFPAASAITLSSWVKIRDYNDSDGYSDIVMSMDSGRDIRVRSALRINFEGRPFYHAHTGSHTTMYAPEPIEINKWCHLVATHDGEVAKLYVDGVKVAENISFGNMRAPYPASGWGGFPLPFQNRPYSFTIGSWSDWWGFSGVIFNGLIDDVRFYNRALSDSEVSDLYSEFASDIAEPPLDSGLILWNRLGSADEVENSDIGDNGSLNAGTFVEGPFGNAVELNMQQKNGVTFPSISLATSAGCYEFWAKLSDFPSVIPAGASPGLAGWLSSAGDEGYMLFFAGNDGNSNGGLCVRSGMGYYGTGRFGYWTYSRAIGGGNVSDWHHYAMSWNSNGVGDGTRKVAVFVDGNLSSVNGFSHTGTQLVSPTNPVQFILLNHQGLTSGRVAFDNLKIWNFDKTDFSDRFIEDAGSMARTLTIDGAKGAAIPDNGIGEFDLNSEVVATVPAVVTNGNTRYLCTGATVAGNDYLMNGLTNVTMSITNNATLTWNWQTQYRLDTQVDGEGSLTTAEMWHDEGSVVELTATPASEWIFSGWIGDAAGCTIDGKLITVPMNQPRSVIAVFIPLEFMTLADYAKLPENLAFRYRSFAGSWFYSNLVGGLYCDSPAPRRNAAMQLSLRGIGILSFEWELVGADGLTALTCSVGSRQRTVKQSAVAESASVAVASKGLRSVRWRVRRDIDSAEVSAVIRNILWTPLEQASQPIPVDQSVILQRDFNGVAWNGGAEQYNVYAGLSTRTLELLGTYSSTSVPAEDFEALIEGAAGKTIYWRVDSVCTDTFGVEAVNRGPLWSMAVFAEGSPEFESSALYTAQDLKVGVFCELPAFTFLNSFEGEVRCSTAGGDLPRGLSLEIRDGAVYVAGVPSRTGHYHLNLKLSVKTGSRSVIQGTTCGIDLTVSDLGVAGSYGGWLSGSLHGDGLVNMKVSSRGRVSGRFTLAGDTYSFKAPFFNGMSNDCYLVSAEVRQGSKNSFPATFAVREDGLVEGLCLDDPDALLVLTRNIWREDGAAEILAVYEGEYLIELPEIDGGGAAVVSISARGRGRARIFGAGPGGRRFSSTTTLMYLPETEDSPAKVLVVVYVRPTSATLRKGLFGVMEVVVDPDGIEPNALTELIPLNWL